MGRRPARGGARRRARRPARWLCSSAVRADFARAHRALVDRDVPVEVVGLGGLLEMPEVSDVVAVAVVAR